MNGAASVMWFIISIFLVRYLYLHKAIPSHVTPISLITYSLAGLLYIDNIDLFIRNTGTETESQIISRAQLTLDLWQSTLQISGGNLKI